MTKYRWKNEIEKACKDAGTYQPFFSNIIDSLALILENRDKVHKQFVDEGSEFTIARYTDRSDKKNVAKNPLLVLEMELNSQALAYWKELGLTMKSWKEVKTQINTNVGGLEALLAGLSDGETV